MNHLMVQSEELKQHLDELARSLAQTTSADTVTMFIYDSKYDEFHLPVGYGLRELKSFTNSLPQSDRLVGKIAKDEQIWCAPDLSKTKEFDGPFSRRERIRSALGLPIKSDSEVVGVLFVSFRTEQSKLNALFPICEDFAKKGAKLIVKSNIIEHLRNQPRESNKTEKTYQSVVDLICTAVHRPAALWLRELGTNQLRVHAATGVLVEYVEDAISYLDDDSIISEVFKHEQSDKILDLFKDQRFKYQSYAKRADWKSMLAIPLKSGRETIGVVELFFFENYNFGVGEFKRVLMIVDKIGLHMENLRRANESQTLSQIAKTLSGILDHKRALQEIVDSARKLTHANQSAIYFFESNDIDSRFKLGSFSPHPDGLPSSLSCSHDGITRYIIESGNWAKVNKPDDDQRCRIDFINQNVNSLVGMPIYVGQERIGVLYVMSQWSHVFSAYDVELLSNLANHAGVALLRARLLEAIQEVEQATSQMFEVDRMAESFLHEVQQLGFEFAALQIIDRRTNLIETEHGVGIAQRWIGLAKHSLKSEPDKTLKPDIQSDVVDTLSIEVIKGYDERFDSWIFDQFDHRELVRIFAPIYLSRDKDGGLGFPSQDAYDWDKPLSKETGENRRNCYHLRSDGVRQTKHKFEVIGTVEAGYYLSSQEWISTADTKRLFELTSKWARLIWETQLMHVLEVVAKNAMRIIGAGSASIHFSYNDQTKRFVYEVSAGKIGPEFLMTYPPRDEGIGQHAMREGVPRYVDVNMKSEKPYLYNLEELKNRYPYKYKPNDGIKAIACFPLMLSQQDIGLLYLHFWQEHQFTSEEVEWGTLFANQAIAAIKKSLSYQENRRIDRALNGLHSVGQFLLANPEVRVPDLLHRVARSARNVLGADIITIYLYDEAIREFPLLPPIMDGNFFENTLMKGQIDPGDAPEQIVKGRGNIYEPNVRENLLLYDPTRPRSAGKEKTFVEREGIVSAAGILFTVGKEILGVIFMNYRTYHEFPDEERRLIETFAATAAIGIYNSKLFALKYQVDELKQLHNVSKAITSASTNLKNVLKQIAVSAKEVLKADLTVIFPYDQAENTFLHDLVTFDGIVLIDESLKPPRGEGITNAAMISKEGYIVIPDTAHASQDLSIDFEFYHQEGIKSFIGVALKVRIDANDSDNNEDEVVGVLYVDFRRHHEFKVLEIELAQMFANFAAIALLTAREQEKRKIDAIKEFNTYGANFAHHVSNLLGPIPPEFYRLRHAIPEIDNPTARAHFDGLEAGIRRLEKILKSAKELSKLARGETEALVPLRFDELIANTKRPFEQILNLKFIENYSSRPLLMIMGRQSMLEMVFSNIFKNAIDAMPDGGKITISASYISGGTFVEIEITDTGIGIAKNQVKNVFEPFKTTKGENLGLGLWLSRNAIRSMDGDVSLKNSELGKGSTFLIKLPAAKGAELKPTKPQILIVEDSPYWGKLIQTMLAKDYECDRAPKLEEASKMIRHKVYDLAIVDISLDMMDLSDKEGLSLIHSARQIYPNMAFIVISGVFSELEVKETFSSEFKFPFFDKREFDSMAFSETVKRILNRNQVLIVEDDPVWAGFYERTFEKLEVNVQCVSSFAEAAGNIRNNLFTLAIIDLCLRGEGKETITDMDGIFLLDHLLGKRIPTFIVTGYAFVELVEEIYREYEVVLVLDKTAFDWERFQKYAKQILDQGLNVWEFMKSPRKYGERHEKLFRLVEKLLKKNALDATNSQGLFLKHYEKQKELGVAPQYSAFISHSSLDKEFTNKLYGDLEKSGLDIFYSPISISPGESIMEKIQSALVEIDSLILVLSPNSVKSSWVSEELAPIHHFKNLGKNVRILPVLIADCEIPPFLMDKRYIDFRGNYNDGLKYLLDALTKGRS